MWDDTRGTILANTTVRSDETFRTTQHQRVPKGGAQMKRFGWCKIGITIAVSLGLFVYAVNPIRAEEPEPFDPTGTYTGQQQCDNHVVGDEFVPLVIGPGDSFTIQHTDTGLVLESLGREYDGVCTNASPGFEGVSCTFVARGCAMVLKDFCEVVVARIGLFFVPPPAAVHTPSKVAFLAHSAFTASLDDPGPPARVFAHCTWDYRR
jgi:hypothetical protein